MSWMIKEAFQLQLEFHKAKPICQFTFDKFPVMRCGCCRKCRAFHKYVLRLNCCERSKGWIFFSFLTCFSWNLCGNQTTLQRWYALKCGFINRLLYWHKAHLWLCLKKLIVSLVGFWKIAEKKTELPAQKEKHQIRIDDFQMYLHNNISLCNVCTILQV